MEHPIPKLKNKFITRLISGYFTMRICIIADQIYKSGGIEKVLSHRINYWINQGHQIHLITSENKNKDPYFFYDQNMIHHDISSNFDKSFSLFSARNLILVPKYFLKLRNTIKVINPEVIVMPNYSYDYYLIPLISKKTYLIKEYHSSFNKGKGLINFVKNAFSKLYDVHVFLSEEEKLLSSIDNSVVIPNPILNINKDIHPLDKRENVVLAAGRIASVKGFERLIECWSAIAKKHPEWRLEIYGDGEKDYINSLNESIRINKISDNTSINNSTPDIIDKMLNSRIYAMTSRTECFPMVLLEAMQSKMAVIAFNCPTGPRNILKHNRTGILVNNQGDFIYQLERLINNISLAQSLADNASEDVKQYSINNVMEMWDALINEGLNK